MYYLLGINELIQICQEVGGIKYEPTQPHVFPFLMADENSNE